MRLGTIRGRHELPVDSYLLDAEQIKPGSHAYIQAYDAAVEAAWSLWQQGCYQVHESATFPTAAPRVDVVPPRVDLYYTGLTEVTLGAIDGFRHMFVDLHLWRYDRDEGYVELHTYHRGQAAIAPYRNRSELLDALEGRYK